MLRITGGLIKGRQIAVPTRAVFRPTQQRGREALFSMLADKIRGCRFLDLFAGSGIVALEAWSRGAKDVTMVDRDRRGCRIMRGCVDRLMPQDGALSAPRIVCDDVQRYLRRIAGNRTVTGGGGDIVFADPPYADGGDGFWEERLASLLVVAGRPARGGLWIMESAARTEPAVSPLWTVVDNRIYGDTRLTFYRMS